MTKFIDTWNDLKDSVKCSGETEYWNYSDLKKILYNGNSVSAPDVNKDLYRAFGFKFNNFKPSSSGSLYNHTTNFIGHFNLKTVSTDLFNYYFEITDVEISRYACYFLAKHTGNYFAAAYFMLPNALDCEELIAQLGDFQRIKSRDKLKSAEKQFISSIFKMGLGTQENYTSFGIQAYNVFFNNIRKNDLKEKFEITTDKPLTDYFRAPILAAKSEAILSIIEDLEKIATGKLSFLSPRTPNKQDVTSLITNKYRNARMIVFEKNSRYPEDMLTNKHVSKTAKEFKLVETEFLNKFKDIKLANYR